MSDELKFVNIGLNPLEYHNLRIVAAKAGKQILPFVREHLQTTFDLSKKSPAGHPAPDASGTTTLPQDSEKSS